MRIFPAAVKLQRGWEYRFSRGEDICAKDLSNLAPKQLDGLPDNNLVTECDLSRFDREARVAKCQNKRFKAKNIRNNMVLYNDNKRAENH